MASASWTLGADDGELLLHTGTAGRVARAGHRLTLRMQEWTAQVRVDDSGHPTAVVLAVAVDSLRVLGGESSITPWTGAEAPVVRSNALKCLGRQKHPTITYRSTAVLRDGDTYRVDGELTIRGQMRRHPLTVTEDRGRFSCTSTVRQSDHGIKPFSLMMGTVQVADEVGVSISADPGRAHR